MDMTGERRIAAPRQIVWDALNDTNVLKASIPGCETLERTSDHQMKATASVKVGPISARFGGEVTLSDIDPPNGYRIDGQGQGGVAGFAKGGARVALVDEGATATLLRYEVNAQVGGKLAQLGARLIDATAKQMADQFFNRFTTQVEAMVPALELGDEADATVTAPPGGAPAPGLAPVSAAPPPVAAIPPRPVHAPPPPTISPFALVPREPLGLPLAFWIGGFVYLIIIVLFLGSAL